MSASSPGPSTSAIAWTRSPSPNRLRRERLPWPVAAPLIAMLSVLGWAVAWKVCVTILAQVG